MSVGDEQQVLIDGETLRSLKEHPGFQKLVEVATKQVLASWSSMLTMEPGDLKYTQGWIAGANFVLEYADAKVVQAELVRKHAQEDDRAALEAQFEQHRQRGRGQRRRVPGADLGD